MLRPRLYADPHGIFLHELVLDSCRRNPDKTALVDASCGRRLTYAEYGDAVESIARGLISAGIQPGDVVAIFLPNSWEFCTSFHAVQLAGAISTLRADAHLPPVPGARTQRFLDAAAGLGEHSVTRLWQDGAAMTPAAAVRLALEDGAGAGPPAGVPPRADQDTRASGLTPREHEVVALLGAGLSNRDIAAKLYISPATAARHVANILAKLGFSSRSQVAVWANRRDELPH